MRKAGVYISYDNNVDQEIFAFFFFGVINFRVFNFRHHGSGEIF